MKKLINNYFYLIKGYDKTKYNNNIYVYKSDNYELIKIIERHIII